MASDATIRPVVRPRGELTKEQRHRLEWCKGKRDAADLAWRVEVVEALREGASFAEVSTFTGLSTNTLQRWKREYERTD